MFFNRWIVTLCYIMSCTNIQLCKRNNFLSKINIFIYLKIRDSERGMYRNERASIIGWGWVTRKPGAGGLSGYLTWVVRAQVSCAIILFCSQAVSCSTPNLSPCYHRNQLPYRKLVPQAETYLLCHKEIPGKNLWFVLQPMCTTP